MEKLVDYSSNASVGEETAFAGHAATMRDPNQSDKRSATLTTSD